MSTVHSILLAVLWLASGSSCDRLEHTAGVPERGCFEMQCVGAGIADAWNAVPTQAAEVLPVPVANGEETVTGRPPEMRPRSPRFMSLGIPRSTDGGLGRRLNRRSRVSNWVPSFASAADFSTLLGRFQI